MKHCTLIKSSWQPLWFMSIHESSNYILYKFYVHEKTLGERWVLIGEGGCFIKKKLWPD